MSTGFWLLAGGAALLYFTGQQSRAKARERFIKQGFGVPKEKLVKMVEFINKTSTREQNAGILKYLRDRSIIKGSVAALTAKDVKDAIDEFMTPAQWEGIYKIEPTLRGKFGPGIPIPFGETIKIPSEFVEPIKKMFLELQQSELGGVGAVTPALSVILARAIRFAI